MSTDSTLQCEDIRSVQVIFVHATYVPFHQLPSVGLPGFFRKVSCTRRTYYFTNYQCGASRFLQEIFVHATYVPFHQLPSVGLPSFFRKVLCTRRTYHFTNYQVWGFPVSSGNFRARDVRTISPTTKCGASRFLQEIFVHVTYVPCSTDNTGARSGSPQLVYNIISILSYAIIQFAIHKMPYRQHPC